MVPMAPAIEATSLAWPGKLSIMIRTLLLLGDIPFWPVRYLEFAALLADTSEFRVESSLGFPFDGRSARESPWDSSAACTGGCTLEKIPLDIKITARIVVKKRGKRRIPGLHLVFVNNTIIDPGNTMDKASILARAYECQ
jgi:hypothetical protein